MSKQQYRNINAATANEPIAIIGIGCRFPGAANDWQAYWSNLRSGKDCITETPPARWNLDKFYSPGDTTVSKTQSKWGGYVEGIDLFDPQLFKISPREAASMDPQQRMLLECTYRAIEDAGVQVGRLAGRSVSVFAGISSFDYAVAGLSYQDRGVIDAYSNTGGSSSIAANRISYCFDLRGPSVAVDTACSSSLVAMHMACESIWRGDAEMALAGGVNALILPDFYVAFSQLGVLSPDGRCKTFDSRANGYVRSEGAGMVMLKPLAAAMRDGDPIYSVVRSTALNQDGRTPGMTVPSQSAQESLIKAACEKAQVEPGDIQYVEAHGTGTPVGDPIEANAIGSVLGAERNRNSKCWIGSVKTNIGHLEAGAGIASVIKVALAMHHSAIPPHLHFQSANPAIDFEALRLQLPTELCDWSSDSPRLAGINGFGYGGANAHIVLESAPQSSRKATAPAGRRQEAASDSLRQDSAESAKPTTRGKENNQPPSFEAPVLLPLSARSKTSLAALAGEYADALQSLDPGMHLAEIAGYIAHRRSHHSQRTTASAADRSSMIEQLREIAASNHSELGDEVSAQRLSSGVAFVLSGQGPQWWGMGRGLLKYSPAFRSAIKRCDRELSKYASWSLMEELTRPESESRMNQTSIAQPSIFAIQVALAAVWESWGVRPAVLVGHSVGEIAAAHLSGALSFEDAALVAFHRGRTMDLASSHGGMLAAGLSAEEVPQWIQGLENVVSIAAINGPTSVTISGAQDAIDEIGSRLQEAGIFWRRLTVEYAFHSPQMEPVREELLRSLGGIRPSETKVPLISTVTGKEICGKEVGADYWWQNVRHSVRFSDAMASVAQRGIGVAVEVGPHPVLAYSINECFQAAGSNVRTVASLNRQQDDLQVITKSLGDLYSMGFDIKWSGFYNKPTRRIDLPIYPFEQQVCWSESLQSRLSRTATPVHPLLGERADTDAPVWQSRIDLGLQRYLSDHSVRDAIMYPAAAMLDTIVAAGREINMAGDNGRPAEIGDSDDASSTKPFMVQRVRFQAACTLTDANSKWIQTRYVPDRRMVELAFRDCDNEHWQPMAVADLSSLAAKRPLESSSILREARSRCNEQFDQDRLYDYCQSIGLKYGPLFKGIQHGVRRVGEAVAEVSLPELDASSAEHVVHPAILDSCFHAMIAADPDFDHTNSGLYLPNEIEEFRYYGNPGAAAIVHCQLISKTDRKMRCDVNIYDADERLCISIESFVSQKVGHSTGKETLQDMAYAYSWIENPLDSQASAAAPAEDTLPPSPKWLIFMDEGGVGREITERLVRRGGQVFEVYRHDSQVAKTATSRFYQADPESVESFTDALRAVFDDAGGTIDSVVYLWGNDVPQPHLLNCTALQESTHLTSVAPVSLVQAWEKLSGSPTARLSVVTAGAQSMEDEPELVSVAAGPLIGMARVIVSEYAALETKLIDLPSQPATTDLDCLVDELACWDGEDEIMWRDGSRFVRRFGRQDEKALPTSVANELPSRLTPGKSASIEEMRYTTIRDGRFGVHGFDPGYLESGELEIEVRAGALNFADVMKSLALYPGMADGPVDLGAECAGVVTRVGSGCRFSEGDPVVAIAPGAFSTHVVVDEALVAKMPENLTFEQACAIPIAFLTAQHAMENCAHLERGDRLLVHSASGGVGLAALQLAKLKGIEVFATAGNDEKRRYLRSLGVEHIMNSRSLDFGPETLAATDGEGVDAVLNSLPGEAIKVGLSTLRTGGHFLEIGKRDIYSDAPLGLYPFRNNLALHAIDLDQLFKRKPQWMGTMLRELMQRFASGELKPIPVKSFAAPETVDAFKYMQSGQHIGKIAVTFDGRPEPVFPGEHSPAEMREDGTYWVVGGLGGFGLEITKWLCQRGAKNLVLTGRSKTPRDAAAEVIEQLRGQGIRVELIPADVTSADEVQRVLKIIDEDLPPLAGVIHTAMVLEDKLIPDLDRETLDRVLYPKVLGGWNLHQQTLGRELDCFILFSSLSSVFGHAGQANYSAANALLDSLAFYRRAQGLPGLVMNWGHLGEVGYLAERDELGQRLQRQGVLSFTVKQATDCLDYALSQRVVQMSVLRIDWSTWRGLGITNRVSPRFEHLLVHAPGESQDGGLATAASLRSASEEERLKMIDTGLRSKAGSLLGVAPGDIPADRALLELGLDSLMAVEMRNWIESHMEISMPIALLMRSESYGELVQGVSELIGGSTPQVAVTSADDSIKANSDQDGSAHESSPEHAGDAEQLLAQLPELNDDEVNKLLGQLLRESE